MRFHVFAPIGSVPGLTPGLLPGGPAETVGLIDRCNTLAEAELVAAEVSGARVWDEVEARVVYGDDE